MLCKTRLILLLVFVSINLKAQVHEYLHQVIKSFPVNNSVTVDVLNKYGKVQVMTWDVDSVKFLIDIRIKAKDEERLEKLKQNIDFEFIPGQYFIIARTKLREGGTDIFKDIIDIAGSYLSAGNSVTINYTIMIPDFTPLKIENKFGDVYMDDLNGNLNLTLSYGDLKANRLNGKSQIKLGSGDGEINYIKDGQLNISYADMHIREAGKLNGETRSSNITIDKLSILKLNTRRDKLYLNDLESLSGESYFSVINIGTLHNDLTMLCRYGDLNIDNIIKSFTQLNITSEYTDLTLGFERSLSFGFDLTHRQDIDFIYPKNLALLKTTLVNAEDKIFLTSGSFGTGTADSKVTITAQRKCDLTISYR
jgi:hypothetical protein